jgi:hypothetical protein
MAWTACPPPPTPGPRLSGDSDPPTQREAFGDVLVQCGVLARRSLPHVLGNEDDDVSALDISSRVTAISASEADGRLIPPKALEPCRRQFRISNRVADIAMPEVILNGSRIVAITRELVSRAMPQHVRMSLKR